jgi:hypothetical protein
MAWDWFSAQKLSDFLISLYLIIQNFHGPSIRRYITYAVEKPPLNTQRRDRTKCWLQQGNQAVWFEDIAIAFIRPTNSGSTSTRNPVTTCKLTISTKWTSSSVLCELYKWRHIPFSTRPQVSPFTSTSSYCNLLCDSIPTFVTAPFVLLLAPYVAYHLLPTPLVILHSLGVTH